jgi:hypothetical protein
MTIRRKYKELGLKGGQKVEEEWKEKGWEDEGNKEEKREK